jgi:hypothetical protein
MLTIKRKTLCALATAAITTHALSVSAPVMAAPQSSGFTYQGVLDANGTLATGTYNLLSRCSTR